MLGRVRHPPLSADLLLSFTMKSHCSRPLTNPRQYVIVEVKTSGQELRDVIQFRLDAPFTLLARANEAIEQATAPW